MIIPKKRQTVNFAQVYSKEDNKPLIKCYPKDSNQKIYWLGQKVVGYGQLSISKDNVAHLYPGKEGKINLEHLRKYQESREKSLLKFMIH